MNDNEVTLIRQHLGLNQCDPLFGQKTDGDYLPDTYNVKAKMCLASTMAL